jgi:hypothetical protein
MRMSSTTASGSKSAAISTARTPSPAVFTMWPSFVRRYVKQSRLRRQRADEARQCLEAAGRRADANHWKRRVVLSHRRSICVDADVLGTRRMSSLRLADVIRAARREVGQEELGDRPL